MKGIFIDTGALVGRIIQRDEHHAACQAAWSRLETEETALFLSEAVLIESANLIARRKDGIFTAEWLDLHLQSKEIAWLRPGHEDLLDAARLMRKYSDQDLSYTDAISFVLMRRERIHKAFGFDRHFLRAGFELWPSA